jgi:hypothetical protein
MLYSYVYAWLFCNPLSVPSVVHSSSSRTTDVSPSACLKSADDDLKVERKRRQRRKKEEFLQQLKKKQLTYCEDPQTKSSVDKETGIQNEYFLLRGKSQIEKHFMSWSICSKAQGLFQ